MAGSNNKVFTAVLDDKPASLANGNQRAFGFYRLIPSLGKALALLFAFSAGTIHGCRCRTLSVLLFALLFCRWRGVGENRFDENRRVSSSLGFHHLAMIVMNKDSNIKNNVSRLPCPLSKPSSPTGHRGVDLISGACHSVAVGTAPDAIRFQSA